jgi:tetratricopeptide (TPR) repeat protein
VTWSLLAFDEQHRLYRISELLRLFATAQPDFNDTEYEATMQGYADYAIELSRSPGWKVAWQTSEGISAISIDIDRYHAHIQTALRWMIGPDRNHLRDPERIIALIDSPFGVVLPYLTLYQIKDWYDTAHQALKETENYIPDDKSRIISNMAAKLWKVEDANTAIVYANEAVELARETRPKGGPREAVALHNLGLAQFKAKDFAAANETLKLAEKMFRKFNNRRDAAHSLLALYALNRQWGVMPKTVTDAYYRDARDLMSDGDHFHTVMEQVNTQGVYALTALVDVNEMISL